MRFEELRCSEKDARSAGGTMGGLAVEAILMNCLSCRLAVFQCVEPAINRNV